MRILGNKAEVSDRQAELVNRGQNLLFEKIFDNRECPDGSEIEFEEKEGEMGVSLCFNGALILVNAKLPERKENAMLKVLKAYLDLSVFTKEELDAVRSFLEHKGIKVDVNTNRADLKDRLKEEGNNIIDGPIIDPEWHSNVIAKAVGVSLFHRLYATVVMY